MIEHRAISIELPGRRRRRAVLSLVPLIDVTFILLILFMLVIQLGQRAPSAITFSSEIFNALSEPGEEAASVKPLTVTLSADGALYLWDRRRISIGDLPAVLQERVGSIVLSGAATPPVVIAPDPEVPLQILIEVMRVAQGNAFFETHVALPKFAAEVTGK